MPELIDRQAVLAEIGEFQIRFNETGDSHERVAYASAEHCKLVIKAAPTIEAEPVRHGRWLSLEGWFNKSSVKCSVCGNTLNMDGVNAGRGDANFCPNCGARMDGGAEQ